MTSSLSVPATVPVIYRGDDAVPSSSVTANELEWAFHRCPISDAVTEATLSLHYGATDAASMIVLFAGDKAAFLPLLLWGGVGTRFQQFAAFLEDSGSKFVQQVATASANPVLRVELLRSAFLGFANHLGRVTTYRALSLTEDAYQRIWDADEIFPTGQLTQTADTLTQIVAAHGIRKVVVARLYIAHLRRLIGYDPSISLHDDWQTTTVIASGYLARRGDEGAVEQRKDLYLFQVSVPVIESLGWTLARVAKEAPDFLGPRYAGHEPWFKFEAPAVPTGVWFDATIQRTERYGLYTVPHLRARIQRVWKFSALEDIAEAVAPFAAAQEVLHSQHPLGANPA